jgi:hypothetical protein
MINVRLVVFIQHDPVELQGVRVEPSLKSNHLFYRDDTILTKVQLYRGGINPIKISGAGVIYGLLLVHVLPGRLSDACAKQI